MRLEHARGRGTGSPFPGPRFLLVCTGAFLLAGLLAVAWWVVRTKLPGTADQDRVQRVLFRRSLANVTYASVPLLRDLRSGVRGISAARGDIWYGEIMRRLPGDGPRSHDHYVAFVVEYSGREAIRARCDADFDRDLTDDPELALAPYPGRPGARFFLVDLAWTARSGDRDWPVNWKLRVVLDPLSAGAEPVYHTQMIYAMTGEVVLDGRPHRALLFDGNGDGVYSRDFFDGVFIDQNDDRHFDIDPMSPEFGPFLARFRMGRRMYEVEEVDPMGTWMTLGARGEVESSATAAPGSPAPDFVYRDTEGQRLRLSDLRGQPVLLYFWASWCGTCVRQAPGLQEIRERYDSRGLRILGISYDTDRRAMESFRKKYRQSWPTSFSGHMFADDEIGHLYQARAPGTAYLIDRSGRIAAASVDLNAIESTLAELTAAGTGSSGH